MKRRSLFVFIILFPVVLAACASTTPAQPSASTPSAGVGLLEFQVVKADGSKFAVTLDALGRQSAGRP